MTLTGQGASCKTARLIEPSGILRMPPAAAAGTHSQELSLCGGFQQRCARGTLGNDAAHGHFRVAGGALVDRLPEVCLDLARCAEYSRSIGQRADRQQRNTRSAASWTANSTAACDAADPSAPCASSSATSSPTPSPK
jgi:hypothetical protein